MKHCGFTIAMQTQSTLFSVNMCWVLSDQSANAIREITDHWKNMHNYSQVISRVLLCCKDKSFS